ncbi:hypothetical protein FH608_022660 [Nonomuraea phyllanthi]|uniref:WD40 repeat domain-containing protein n=1 Tax=Nonomuraea phyllanthi TaxID=2219224 RepID=A0A5C4WBS7_9ACTN|nr:hypothetical protein [Nonomuraea phyllanthi]KAB8193122.1 hypothetical protein FH608_022660 [Nonomuraea phyllanthi]
MKHPSMAAALLAPAVIAGLGLGAGAAHARTGAPAARAAWVKTCSSKKSPIDHPCGGWRLIMRDGRQVVVRGAAGTEDSAFAISADGRVMAYERAGDHRLVVQPVAGGPARPLPKAVGGGSVSLMLSPTGDKVSIDRAYSSRGGPAKVVTVATGHVATLPRGDIVLGFSGDGDEVLTQRVLSDNTTRLAAHALAGGSVKRTPPQVVAGAVAFALAADGHTVAAFSWGDADRKRPPRVRTYDLRTGELSASAGLPLESDTEVHAAWWDAGGRLHASVRRGGGGETTVVRVLTVDPESGRVTQNDRYSVSKSAYASVTAGE